MALNPETGPEEIVALGRPRRLSMSSTSGDISLPMSRDRPASKPEPPSRGSGPPWSGDSRSLMDTDLLRFHQRPPPFAALAPYRPALLAIAALIAARSGRFGRVSTQPPQRWNDPRTGAQSPLPVWFSVAVGILAPVTLPAEALWATGAFGATITVDGKPMRLVGFNALELSNTQCDSNASLSQRCRCGQYPA